MIVNSTHSSVIPDYLYEILKTGDITESELVDMLPEETKRELLSYISVYEDLQRWQNMFSWTGCKRLWRIFDWKYNQLIYVYDNLSLDGYSQAQSSITSTEDRQCFSDGVYINLFIADVDSGICCRINKETSECTYYAIGEDDGHWFITDLLWKHVRENISYWKNLIMSEVSELRIAELDNQKVIENIWNSDLNVQKKYMW